MPDRETKDETLDHSEASYEESSKAAGVHSAIGQRLRAYYDDVASEPVPEKFLSLLDQLDAAEASSGRKGNE